MSNFSQKRIYKLDFVEINNKVQHSILAGLLGFEIPAAKINFGLMTGKIHGDYAQDDFYHLSLDQVIDPAYLLTLSVEQQALITNIDVGDILPPATFFDAIVWANPVKLLGAAYYVNTESEAFALKTNYVLKEGNNISYGDSLANNLYGNSYEDFIKAGSGNDMINGEAGDDYIMGEDGNDLVIGGLGDDWLGGMKDNDIIVGQAGNDFLEGGQGQDELYGGIGNDTLHGNEGDDYLTGGSGNDVLNGSMDNDNLSGGDDADVLIGAEGNDILIGEYYMPGQGWNFDYSSDTFVMGFGWGNDIVKDFGYGLDVLDLRAFNFATVKDAISFATQVDKDVVFTFSDGSTLTLENYNLAGLNEENIWIEGDKPIVAEPETLVIYGTDSADYIAATAPGQTIYAGDGSDEIYAIEGIDTIWGQGGDDYIASGAGDDWVYGEIGNDNLHGNLGSDHIYGEEGDDKLFGDEDADYLLGGIGADTLDGGTGHDVAAYWTQKEGINLDLADRSKDTGDAIGDTFVSIEEFDLTIHNDSFNGTSENDRVNGLAGDDILVGNAGDDYLFGSEGNDTLNGGTGDDRLYLGDGADTLVFAVNDGFDQIYQFNALEDMIEFHLEAFKSYVDLIFTSNGLNLFLDYGTGNIMLHEVSLNSITEDNFTFV